MSNTDRIIMGKRDFKRNKEQLKQKGDPVKIDREKRNRYISHRKRYESNKKEYIKYFLCHDFEIRYLNDEIYDISKKYFNKAFESKTDEEYDDFLNKSAGEFYINIKLMIEKNKNK